MSRNRKIGIVVVLLAVIIIWQVSGDSDAPPPTTSSSEYGQNDQTETAAAPAVPDSGTVYIPLFTYRTGAYAASGIPIANGMSDYLEMLNARDGGIGGAKIIVEECETGYQTDKGVECYESVKSNNPLVINPYSTGITLQLIQRASTDQIPILSMGYGLSAAAVGDVFPWVFNFPTTYWGQASAIVDYIDGEEDYDLAGKKIGYIYLDVGYGREPLPVLQNLAEELGFELVTYPVEAKSMNEQSSQWLQISRDNPDWMIMWGWGAMNPTAVKEAAKVGYPMDRFIGSWWSGGESDVRPTGAEAEGYKSVNFHGVGDDYQAIQDIKKYVYDAGNSRVDSADEIGENLYNRGVVNSVFMAEAIRAAQQKFNIKGISAEQMRWGLENLDISAERFAELGLDGFASRISVSCSDHSGGHPVFIQQWQGDSWTQVSDRIEPLSGIVRPLLVDAAQKYAESNSPWPPRTEPC